MQLKQPPVDTDLELRSAHCATPALCASCGADCGGRENLRRLRADAIERIKRTAGRGYTPEQDEVDIFDALCAEGIATKIHHATGTSGVYRLTQRGLPRQLTGLMSAALMMLAPGPQTEADAPGDDTGHTGLGLQRIERTLRSPTRQLAAEYLIDRSAFTSIDLPRTRGGRTKTQRDKRAARKITKAARRKNRK